VYFQFLILFFRVKAIPSIEGENRLKYEKDLKFIHDSVKELLESSSLPNHGKDFIEMIQKILQREEHWISWKNASCPAFERTPPTPVTVVSTEGETAEAGVKRKFDEISDTTTENKAIKNSSPISIYEQAVAGFEEKRNSFLFDCSDENIKEIAKNLVASYPDFESQINVSYSMFIVCFIYFCDRCILKPMILKMVLKMSIIQKMISKWFVIVIAHLNFILLSLLVVIVYIAGELEDC
jgi:hypothetical protein